MPTAPHIIRSPAALGIDEDTRPELVEFGASNLRSENIRAVHQGEATTRYGFAALPNERLDGTTPTAGYKLFADRTSAIRITDSLEAEAYSSKAQAWATLGRVPEATARITDLPSMGIATYLEDVDATNGYIAISWASVSTGTGISCYLAIIDQATGAVLRAPEKVSTNTDTVPGLLSVQGNYFVMARYNGAGTKIEAWYLDTTSAATITAGWIAFGASLATDATGFVTLHALPDASTPLVALLYSNNSGGTDRLTLKTFNIAGVVQTQTILTNSVTPTAFALGGFSNDTLWLAWNQVSDVWVRGVQPFSISVDNASRALIMTPGAAVGYLGIAGSTTLGKARVWGSDDPTPSARMAGVQTVAGVATLDGTATDVMGVLMVRKPVFYGGRYYGAFFNIDGSANGQNNFFICDWTEDSPMLRPVANPAPGLSTAGLAGQGKIIPGNTATQLIVGFGIKRSAIADGSALLELDFANAKRWQATAHANSTFLAAAVPSAFDGVRVAEIGFLYRPPQPTILTTAGPLSTTNSVGWKYICVYEETDADGNWCVSGLSDPSAGTGPISSLTPKTLAPQTQPLAITSRSNGNDADARGVRIAFYRTDETGQAPYYRAGTALNSSGFVYVQYLDNMTDAVLRAQSVLYSQPGVNGTSQDRRPPPAFSSIVSYNGMLVGASGSDVWSSAQNVPGEGVWFNPIWQVPIPGDGDITALAVMDGTLFVFKRSEIYAIAGEPPSDNGATGGLGVPRRLACDVGATSNVTCTTAVGIFFQSERGIEALTRAQTVDWIGEKIHRTVDDFPVVTSMTVDPASAQSVVLIDLATSSSGGLVTGTGKTIVFDLSTNRWISTDRRTSYAGVVDAPAQSACVISTSAGYRYAWMTSAGVVHFEDRTTYLDANGAFVVPLIETAWFDGFKNEQSVWSLSVLFERYTACGLLVETAFDYGDYSLDDSAVWTDVDTTGQRQLECRPKPRGETLKFRITTTTPDNALELGTGQGFGFIAFALDLTAKQGPVMGTLRLDPTLRR